MATSQGIPAATPPKTARGREEFLEPLEGSQPYHCVDLSPAILVLDLWPPEPWENPFLLR